MTDAVLVAGGRERALRRLVGDLAGWWGRRPAVRPADITVAHSSALRTTVFLVVGGELFTEGLMDVSMLPPAWQPYHIVWMALVVDACVAFTALTKRNPHRVTPSGELVVRAGLFDEITLPLAAVASVGREWVTAPGRGIRPVPGRDGSVVCTVAGTADLVVELAEPAELRRADGSSLTVRRLHLSADRPADAHRALAAAVRGA
ncbi:hypothetical protein [Streptomyces sp. NRRL F-5126]|uniref:hypothetical protein n=1 Tax=Streptomyces sp. NRRL F-5126 TaxID=1463857 RepID=UPI0004CC1DD4|nr:hypothetical protein [Streptomyces sp. NRRL F-5126]